MPTQNTVNILNKILPKRPKKNPYKYFFSKDYEPPTPKAIKDSIKNLLECPNCHFLIFDNYWINDTENSSIKLCQTCGYKL